MGWEELKGRLANSDVDLRAQRWEIYSIRLV